MRALIVSLPLLGAGIAGGQVLTPAVPGAMPPAIVVTPPVVTQPGVPVAPPLTPATAPSITQRFDAYLQHQRAAAPSVSALRAAGLSAENDAIETALPVGPAHLAPLSVPAVRVGAVDPAVADVARSTLRARLGRDPTQAELDAELSAFDARIAQINRSLVTLRPQIATALKADGAFPRRLEAAALGVAPAAADVNAPQAREGLRALWQTLLAR